MNVLGIRGLLALTLLGTAVVAASSAPLMRDKPAQSGGYGFNAVLSLGGAEADDESFFYEKVGSIEVDSDASGNIYVLDNGNTRVQVFDSQGNYLRTIGSEGDGPGELRMPRALTVNSRGDVALFDIGQGRITVFDTNGEVLRDMLVQGAPNDVCLADNGFVYLAYGKRGPAAVQAFDTDGEIAWEGGQLEPAGGMNIKMEIGIQTIAPRLVVLASGVAFRTPEGDYLLEKFDGKTEAAFARSLDRRAFTEEELSPPDEEEGEAHVIVIRRGGDGGHGDGGGGGGGGGISFSADGGHHFDLNDLKKFMPTHHSATRGVLAWPDGRVWVLTSEEGRNGNQVDEWSSAGEWLRRFEIPREYEWLNVGRDGSLYGVTHDEDDYPTVHRVDVQEAGA